MKVTLLAIAAASAIFFVNPVVSQVNHLPLQNKVGESQNDQMNVCLAAGHSLAYCVYHILGHRM